MGASIVVFRFFGGTLTSTFAPKRAPAMLQGEKGARRGLPVRAGRGTGGGEHGAEEPGETGGKLHVDTPAAVAAEE